MFILLFLYIGKKGWQFFVLLLYFLCELFYYFFLFYVICFTLKKIIFIFLFNFYFCCNVLAIYLNFYFYVLIVFFNFLKILIFSDIYPRNIFSIFFLLLFYFLLIKIFIYCFVFITKNICHYFLNNFINSILITFSNVYKKPKTSKIFFCWFYLTKFLRIKHYKASIFFIYVCYLSVAIHLLWMNFNP